MAVSSDSTDTSAAIRLTAFAAEDGHLDFRSELRVPSPACVVFARLRQEE